MRPDGRRGHIKEGFHVCKKTHEKTMRFAEKGERIEEMEVCMMTQRIRRMNAVCGKKRAHER